VAVGCAVEARHHLHRARRPLHWHVDPPRPHLPRVAWRAPGELPNSLFRRRRRLVCWDNDRPVADSAGEVMSVWVW
jgi:hypothetical protein